MSTAQLASPRIETPAWADSIGRSILQVGWFDILLYSAIAIGVITLVARAIRGRWPRFLEVMGGVLGLASAWTGLTIGSALLLINPPDCESLGDIEKRVLGLVAVFVLGIYAGYLVTKSLLKPDPLPDRRLKSYGE